MQVSEVTARDVRAWLTALAPSAVVGNSRMSFSCPLATFLSQRVIPVSSEVSLDGYTLNVYGVDGGLPEYLYDLADWVLAFVDHIDRLDEWGRIQVTAAQALTVFDDVLCFFDNDESLPLVILGASSSGE